MANKTVQALKISATITLDKHALIALTEGVLDHNDLHHVFAASAKVRVSHAIASRFDDPAHSARVTERIAAIKAGLAARGTIDAWHVTAGAVPADQAEVLEPAT